MSNANSAVTSDLIGLLMEAEAFDDYGGWTLDSQFEPGWARRTCSPTVWAAPSRTPRPSSPFPRTVSTPSGYGRRTGCPSTIPAGSPLSVNGTPLDVELGADGKDWSVAVRRHRAAHPERPRPWPCTT